MKKYCRGLSAILLSIINYQTARTAQDLVVSSLIGFGSEALYLRYRRATLGKQNLTLTGATFTNNDL